jgi:alanine racemase
MSVPVATLARIHEDRLRRNVQRLQARLGSVDLMGVVKADAYGHGAVRVARILESEDVPCIAVATLAEAVALREAGIHGPLLVFAPPTPEGAVLYAAFDLQAVIDAPRAAKALTAAGVNGISVHVKVDTGMGRYGVSVEQAPDLLRLVEQAPGLRLAGLWSHFADSDTPDSPQTARQMSRFRDLLDVLGGHPPCPVHLANSGAIYTTPESIDPRTVSSARAGIALYGLLDVPRARAELEPVMEVVSTVNAVRHIARGATVSYGADWTAPSDTVLAVVGAGYADGISRLLSNRGRVSIGGKAYPIRGRVCMDAIMVELGPGNPDSVAEGDAVTLLGDQPTAFEIADACGTITYEVACRISQRVRRIAYNPGRARE